MASWKKHAGRTSGSNTYQFGDVSRSLLRKMSRSTATSSSTEADSTPGIETEQPMKRDTWRDTAGRRTGKDSYQFGDLSRTAVKRMLSGAQEQDAGEPECPDCMHSAPSHGAQNRQRLKLTLTSPCTGILDHWIDTEEYPLKFIENCNDPAVTPESEKIQRAQLRYGMVLYSVGFEDAHRTHMTQKQVKAKLALAGPDNPVQTMWDWAPGVDFTDDTDAMEGRALSWKAAAGRSSGSASYQFGDISRSLARKVFYRSAVDTQDSSPTADDLKLIQECRQEIITLMSEDMRKVLIHQREQNFSMDEGFMIWLREYMPDDLQKIHNTEQWGRNYGGHRALWRHEWQQRLVSDQESNTDAQGRQKYYMPFEEYEMWEKAHAGDAGMSNDRPNSGSNSQSIYGGISVINHTSVDLQIVLSHLTPVHWNTRPLQPGQGAKFHVGRVWFTIEARPFSYKRVPTQTSTALKIAMITSAAVVLPAAAVFAAPVLGIAGAVAATGAAADAAVFSIRTPTSQADITPVRHRGIYADGKTLIVKADYIGPPQASGWKYQLSLHRRETETENEIAMRSSILEADAKAADAECRAQMETAHRKKAEQDGDFLKRQLEAEKWKRQKAEADAKASKAAADRANACAAEEYVRAKSVNFEDTAFAKAVRSEETYQGIAKAGSYAARGAAYAACAAGTAVACAAGGIGSGLVKGASDPSLAAVKDSAWAAGESSGYAGGCAAAAVGTAAACSVGGAAVGVVKGASDPGLGDVRAGAYATGEGVGYVAGGAATAAGYAVTGLGVGAMAGSRAFSDYAASHFNKHQAARLEEAQQAVRTAKQDSVEMNQSLLDENSELKHAMLQEAPVLKAAQLPRHWAKMKTGQSQCLRRIGVGTPVFAAIEAMCTPSDVAQLGKGADWHDSFNAGALPKVFGVWQNQNHALWNKYIGGRAMVQAVSKSKGGMPKQLILRRSFQNAIAKMPDGHKLHTSAINETLLLHSPSLDAVESMLNNGFNEHYSGSNCGTAFGDGCYFAEDICKTDQYARREARYDSGNRLHRQLYGGSFLHPGDVFYVIVARVVMGNYLETASTQKHQPGIFAMGGSNRRELDNIAGYSPATPHHALVGSAFPRFREFISFHSEYIYPEYLVAYQRER